MGWWSLWRKVLGGLGVTLLWPGLAAKAGLIALLVSKGWSVTKATAWVTIGGSIVGWASTGLLAAAITTAIMRKRHSASKGAI
jgi:hypothetical protein